MKNTLNTKISKSPEFVYWLKAQKGNEFNYNSSFNRWKMLEKNKAFFATTFILMLIGVNLLVLLSFLVYFN